VQAHNPNRIAQWTAIATAALVVIADRASKLAIDWHLRFWDAIPIIPGWLRLVHTENPGAAFGVLADGNPWVRSGILIGVSGIVLLFVATALFRRRSSFASNSSRLGLSLILGGAAGNLYDRVLHGTVTDFIEVYHGSWSFPAFNVADSAITIGAFLLLIDMLRSREADPVPADSGLSPK
jgi:signal peptidase II